MNNILIQLINNSSRFNKKRLINLIGVDLEHFQPEIFNGKHYNINKKLYSDDLFLFINEKGRLVGATIGATYQKSFEDFCVYDSELKKNRKGVEEKSKLVLRIPSENRIYRARFNKKYNKELPKKPSLNKRLSEYKNNKNKNLNDDQIKEMLRELMTTFSNNIFNNDFDTKKFKPVTRWNSSIEELISSITNLSKDYKRYLGYLTTEKNEYEKNNINWKKENSWYYKEYLSTVTIIADWHKILNN